MLVLQQRDWPAADGSTGITSASIMDDVEAAGRAIEVGSNFFLFFSSEMSSHSAHMHVHPTNDGQSRQIADDAGATRQSR